jgi:phosphinothricin acetyltransferase
MDLRTMTPADWPAVRAIYEAGIATGNATLETEAPAWEAWDGAHRMDCRIVATDPDDVVIGWVALSPASGRCVYEGVAEVSIYVAPEAQGRGVGRALLRELITDSERHGIWTLQAGIQVENAASLALHERCGFRRIGVRERLGRDATGRWRDVAILERRSPTVGT